MSCSFYIFTLTAIASGLLMAGTAAAQDSTDTDPTSQTVVDPNFFATPKAKAMGGALAPFAEGADAAWHNPAGIGGRGNKKLDFMRQVQFPYAAVAVGTKTLELQNEFNAKGGAEDATIGAAIIDAHAGERQYGRISLFPNVGLGRLIVGPIVDQQLAAVPKGGGSDLVDTHYRSLVGFGAGLSFSDSKGRLQLGIFATSFSVTEVKGDVEYSKVIDTDMRADAIKDNKHQYSGGSHNLGLSWLIGKTAAPTLSIVGRNVAGTKYVKKDPEAPDYAFDPDWSLGLGVSPTFGKTVGVNFGVQADRLTDSEVTMVKKLKVGCELFFGSHPFRPLFSIRAGYNSAGASVGAGFNIGLIGMEYANYAEDVGVGNTKTIERRKEASVIIDLVEF